MSAFNDEQDAAQLREARFVRTLRYETADMAELRRILTTTGATHQMVDTFKHCLNLLEQNGFSLAR